MPSPFHGDRLKTLRTERGWSQADLAEKIGSDARQVSRYENGRVAPSLDVLAKIADTLDTSVDYLIIDTAPRRALHTPENALAHQLADFATRLASARKTAGLTQQVLADRTGVHVTQLRRYEAGTNQPTLDVLRALALALSVSTDSLVFTDDERGPTDPGLRLHLEAINHLDPDERNAIRTLIEGTLLRHQARRLAAS